MKALLIFACLLLGGCDSVVSSSIAGPAKTEQRSQSRHKTAYCYTCAPGFSGKHQCEFKLSGFCPGTKQVLVRITPIKETLESGSTRLREETITLDTIKPCH